MILLTTTLGVAIVLSGCSTFSQKNQNDYSYNTNNYNYTQQYNESVEISTTSDIPMHKIIEGNVQKTNLNYSQTNNLNFQEYLSNYNVYYEYEKLYDFDDAIAEYNELKNFNSHNITIKNITSEEIYNQVLKNNKIYLENSMTSTFKEMDNGRLNTICDMIATTVNDFIKENPDISEERIKCVLSDLKILNQNSSVSNAYVSTDNCFIVSPNMLEIAQMINGHQTDKDVFIHEIIHLMQKGCNCDLKVNDNLERNYGFGYKFKDVKLNSIDFTWLYESSAEKCMINYTGSKALVYKNMISYLESLSISNILNDSYKVNDTENLSFKRDLNSLFDYFSAKTDAEKKEVLNIMYSIEIMQCKPDDFYDLYSKAYSIDVDANEIDEINYTLKPSICISLSKNFYKNLSNAIVNENVTLEDVFYLVSLFENDINNHIEYNDNNKLNYNEYFINSYMEIQTAFFSEISKSLGCNEDDLFEQFSNYAALVKDGDEINNNCDLNFVSSDKIEYLNERQEALKGEAAPSVYNIYKSLESKKTY